jgi:hypothetical protein
MTDILQGVIARSRAGERAAIPSVCSAHPEVIEASLRLARASAARGDRGDLEPGEPGRRLHRANRPADFVAQVNALADKAGLDRAQSCWAATISAPRPGARSRRGGDGEGRAMVRAYAKAGFTKLHLDCSEGCAGEPAQLPDDVTVPRAAPWPAPRVEAVPPTASSSSSGTEVPPPGGARAGEHGHRPHAPQAARATLDAHKEAFRGLGRIGGPRRPSRGVEFGAIEIDHLPTRPRSRPARGRRPTTAGHRARGALDGLPAPPRPSRASRSSASPSRRSARPDLRRGARGSTRWTASAQIAGLDRPRPVRDDGIRHACRSVPLAAPPRRRGGANCGSSATSPTPTASATTGPVPTPRRALGAARRPFKPSACPIPFSTRLRPRVPRPAEALRSHRPVDALLQASVQEALAPYFFKAVP